MSFTLDENDRVSMASYPDINDISAGHVPFPDTAGVMQLLALQARILLSLDQRLNELCDYIAWKDAERIKNQ